MSVIINCSWCNKTMGSIELDRIKHWDKGEICDECIEKKDRAEVAFKNVVERVRDKAQRLEWDAKEMLEKEIKEIAKG